MNSKLEELIKRHRADRPSDIQDAIAYLEASRAWKIAALEEKIAYHELGVVTGGSLTCELDGKIVSGIVHLENAIDALKGSP